MHSSTGQIMKKTIFSVLSATILFLPALAAATSLATALVEAGSVDDVISLDGRIEAVHQSTVSAQTSGRITEIFFDVDDYVPKDAVILRFRDTDQQARLQQAQAAETEANARLQQAQAEYARISQVYEKKLVARAAMDKATADRNAAQARLQQAQAQVAAAREELENTVVRAPYPGILTRRHVEVGEMAAPGKPLVTGLSLENLRAVTDIPQAYVNRVREQQTAAVLVNGRRLQSDKLVVFPYADEASHGFRARVEFPSGEAGLYPGMFIKVLFKIGQRNNLTIPASALVFRGEVTGVYVVDDKEQIHFRQVRVGDAVDGRREIRSGLEAGERVAVEPAAALLQLKQQAN
jgi:RND family efflux transporter MFP subunit